MGKLLDSVVRMHRGRPSIFINGEYHAPLIYALTDSPGGRLSFEEVPARSISRFVKMGFRLFQLDIWLDDMWLEDGTFDISMARRQIKGITDACPGARVFLRWHTTPPKWWNDRNREELVEFADTPATPEEKLYGPQRYLIQDLNPVYRHSFASEKWLEDSTGMLIRFLKELSATPEGCSLAGLQPATGVYGEHHYWAFMKHEPDTGISMTRAFRKYLKDKYGDDENLGEAWGNPNATIQHAKVPGMDDRANNQDGIFRKLPDEMNVVDYYDCQHKLVADSVVHFCRVIKENWPSPIITGAFYGYYISVFGRASAGGHLSEQTILNSPYVDCLCGPQAYDKNLRNLGGAGSSRGMLESALLHGKLWLDEMDQPTHTGSLLGGMPVYRQNASKQILRRNSIFPITHGAGLWYYDFGPYNASGWWDHKIYEDEITSLKAIIEAYLDTDYDSPAETLLVFDTEVFKHTAMNSHRDPITDASCINLAYPMALRSGAAVDTVYLSDIEMIDAGKYKLVIFMNAFVISEKRRDYITENLYSSGRHILWMYAPGYISGVSAETDNISNLTGMDLEKTTIRGVPAIKSGRLKYGLYPIYEKLYDSPSDYPQTALFIKKGAGNPALYRNEVKGCTVWYSPVPMTTPEAFRHVMKEAGVHIYSSSNDSITAGSGLLSIHTEKGGPRTINLPDGNSIELQMDPAETVLIDYNTGKILLRG